MDEKLPGQSTFVALGAARIQEIKAIISKLDKCEHGSRVFQNLPRHMQRRAVSSNPRRLPQYLRERHMREGGANVRPTHRPRRKYRRRPSNLLAEYNRRQKQYVWLETHVWHAKRFHMKQQWGYNLPRTPSFKGYRASLRAATKSCLLQDVSFLCCIELEGVAESLLSGLTRLVHPTSLDSLTNAFLHRGRMWSSVMLYSPDKQPYGAVGEVDVLCHPPSRDSALATHPQMTTTMMTTTITLWMWVHPSIHTQVVNILVQVYQLLKCPSIVSDFKSNGEKAIGGVAEDRQHEILIGIAEDKQHEGKPVAESDTVVMDTSLREARDCESKSVVESDIDVKDTLLPEAGECERKSVAANTSKQRQKSRSAIQKAKDVNREKIALKNIPFERCPRYASSSGSVRMRLLKDTLNRFRLTGPLALSVMSAALHPASVTDVTMIQNTVSEDGNNDGSNDESTYCKNQPWWWREYYNTGESVTHHWDQATAWGNLLVSRSHPSEKCILPLVVRDPRTTLPHKKVPLKVFSAEKGEDVVSLQWPAESALYISELRDRVTLSKEPDAVINQRRAQFLVPGSTLPETPNEHRLPLLFLARPPTGCAHHGSGWDIVVPGGWGMSVWMSLIYCGGMPGGQCESETLHMELNTPLPPHLLPDTQAGECYSRCLADENRTKYFKRPPACRHNYIKLGVQFPFSHPWRRLMQEWMPGTQDIYALRDTDILTDLALMVKDTRSITDKSRKRKVVDVNDSTRKKKMKTDTREGKNTDVPFTIQEAKTEGAMSDATQHATDADDINRKLEGVTEYGCLVMVKVELCYQGNMDPFAMICLPSKEDLLTREKNIKPSEQREDITELPHTDTKAEYRAELKREHHKIKDRMQQQRRKARKKVSMETDIVALAQSEQTVEELMTEALQKVQEENKEILEKYSTYNEVMENAWLVNRDQPFHSCSRMILGYVTHGTFSHTIGRPAGIGWVALNPLMTLVHRCRKVNEQISSNQMSDMQIDGEKKDEYKGCLVLVRNTTTLQYRWAKLSILTKQ